MKDYCSAKNWSVYKIYEDAGFSAKSTNRPSFQEMIKDSKNQKFDIILFYKLDRFSRSLRDFILTVEELINNKIDIASLSENIDTTTAMGEFITNLFASLAQLERKLIKERVEGIMFDKIKQGLPPQSCPKGYKAIKRKGKIVNVVIDKTDSIVIKEIFKLTSEGVSYKKICSKFNIGSSSYYNIIRNKFYYGKIEWQGELYDSKAEPIISKELFDEVQEKLNKNG